MNSPGGRRRAWRPVRIGWLGDIDVFRFEPTTARYVRLHCTTRAVAWQAYTVYKLGVYEAISE